MKGTYLDLDLFRLSSECEGVDLDRQLVLLDNFDDVPGQGNGTDVWFVNHPVKLSFTVVMFCLEGWIRVQSGLQDFMLCANDVLVLQEGAIGRFRGMSEDARIAVIALGTDFFRVPNLIDATMSLKRQLYASPLCHLEPGIMEEAMAVYRLMKAKIKETDNPFRRGALLGYLQVLTYNAYRYILDSGTGKEKKPEKLSRCEELYNGFIRLVHKNYTRERSVSFYADALCVTPKYLSQIIHKVSGRFASEWITDYVILEAKALLKSRKYTVQQVADMLSFANQSFFGRYFKDKVGCSPSEYQKQE
ncbi:helix-turn-helix domain-containing protein [Paraprevotella clara]|uniref:helix-turn-helix domain-containing protein n=1 Tax=Paraprevotella clara TaxID=454154 RepID=UPI0026768C11|nr:helix-turn-helix domain-containing protein [Paraprevotella clara]